MTAATAGILSDPLWSEKWLAALLETRPLAQRPDLHATDFDGQKAIIGHLSVARTAAGMSSICSTHCM